MMFKGTDTIGTMDAAKDAEFRAAQERVRNQLRDLHLGEQYGRWRAGDIDDPWDPTHDTKEMAELRKEFQALVEAQGKITRKNEFDKIYKINGASVSLA
jgi:hypothetical protein